MKSLTRIRLGLYSLVVGSLLGIIGLLLRGHVPLPNIDIDAWATAVTSNTYYFTQIFLIFAYVVPYLGFWALYTLLAKNENAEKIAFWGFLGSIVGTSLALPTLGIFSFINPPIAQLYLQGNTKLPDIIIQVATGWPAIVNISGGTIYLIGTWLIGVAIWRSGLFPRWSGILFGLHGLFLVFGFTIFPVLILSWVFLFIASLWVLASWEKTTSS